MPGEADGGRGYPESPSLLRRVTVGERKPRLQSNGIVSIYCRVAWQQKKVEPCTYRFHDCFSTL